ncbi:hypothetical protein, partial [Rice orange leaf phytoplasma]|uniref:hypothetical protein n=1 Tax=Rice orange leaf phytoplasma TaxID=146897 RepID=UPI000A7B8EE6
NKETNLKIDIFLNGSLIAYNIQEVVLQNNTQIETNLPQLKDVYAKFILKGRCTIEDQATLLKTITFNDSNNPNQNGMKEKLVKDLEKLHTNYEKIYQEQKETI